MNRNRKEIPKEIKTNKDLLYSTKLLKSKNLTLSVYEGKPNKNVLILSTVHKSISVSDGNKKVPDTIQYYNDTKYGVVVLNQMAMLCDQLYQTKRNKTSKECTKCKKFTCRTCTTRTKIICQKCN